VDDRELSLGEYVALGLLAMKPLHGYELARRWASGAVGEVMPAEQSVVYGYLRGLERQELVDWDEVKVGNRPPRRIYALNEDGWVALRGWLRTPVTRMRQVRLDLLLKWYLLEQVDPRAVPGLITAQLAVCKQYVAEANERLQEAEGFSRLVAESRLTVGEATLAWLQSVRGRREDEAAS